MPNFYTRQKINTHIGSVTGVCPTQDTVLAGQSGISYGVTQMMVANLDGITNSVKLYSEGGQQITPQITLGASGTFIWDVPGGEQLELGIGSGLNACLGSSGSSGMEVAVYYVRHDERNPDWRGTAIIPAKNVTRAPNRFGGQSKS